MCGIAWCIHLHCTVLRQLTYNLIELSYQFGNWCNGFATAAVESVKMMIKDNSEHLSTKEEIQEYVSFLIEEVSVHNMSTRWVDLDDGTEKTIKPLMTTSFHWREWSEGKQKKVSINPPQDITLTSKLVVQGFLQHQLISCTLTLAHLVGLEDINK